MEVEFKHCPNCGEDLPIQRFHKNRNNRDGHHRICAECRSRTRVDYKNIPPMEQRYDSLESTDVIRFSQLYELSDEGCWVWVGCYTGPYPSFWFKGNRIRAHRFALLATGADLSVDDQVHHRCHNAGCVNPNHLEALSPEEHRAYHSAHRKKARKRLDRIGRSRASRRNYGQKVGDR